MRALRSTPAVFLMGWSLAGALGFGVLGFATLGFGVLGSSPLKAETAPSPAQTPSAGPTVGAVLDACQADMKMLCGSEPFPGGLMRCMRQSRKKLSQGCQATMAELRRDAGERREAMRPAMQAMRQACEADVKSVCGTVEPGRGRLMACMRENRDKVSDACKTAMAGVRRMMQDRPGGERERDRPGAGRGE